MGVVHREEVARAGQVVLLHLKQKMAPKYISSLKTSLAPPPSRQLAALFDLVLTFHTLTCGWWAGGWSHDQPPVQLWAMHAPPIVCHFPPHRDHHRLRCRVTHLLSGPSPPLTSPSCFRKCNFFRHSHVASGVQPRPWLVQHSYLYL